MGNGLLLNINKLGLGFNYLKMYGEDLAKGFGELSILFKKISIASGGSTNAISLFSQGVKTYSAALQNSLTNGVKFSDALIKNAGSAQAASAMMAAATAGISLAIGAIIAFAPMIRKELFPTLEELKQKSDEAISTFNSNMQSITDTIYD